MNAPLFSAMGGHQIPSATRTDDWATPPETIASLGGWESFGLDPCAMVNAPFPTARRVYTIVENGLIQVWDREERVWLNPPYRASVIGQWLGRMAEHNYGTALIFARTETAAFFSHVWGRASALLFLAGRLNFYRPDGKLQPRKSGPGVANAGAPSVLCAYGQHDAEILADCGLVGHFVPLRLPRFMVVAALDQTWLEAVADFMRAQRGPVALADLYRAFAAHHKTRRNPNYQAKIRQVLQQGPFSRVGRGQWAAA